MQRLPFRPFRPAAALAALAALAAAPAAQAADAYVATGFPWLVVGVAQPVSPAIALRADWATLGQHAYSGSTSDNDYRGDFSYQRVALLADWYPAGGFRVTGGVHLANGKATLRATSKGSTITIGGTTYHYTGDVTSDITLPDAAPYLGIGWGRPGSDEKGLSFHADLGLAFGKARATPLKAEGEVAQYVTDADLAEENRRFQDGVADVKAIPQFTIGVAWRF